MVILSLLLAASASFSSAAEPKPPSPETMSLKLLTFNVAGIPLMHSRWAKRRKAIARGLSEADYDIIALQEVWFDRSAKILFRDSGFAHKARSKASSFSATGCSSSVASRSWRRAISSLAPGPRGFPSCFKAKRSAARGS